MKTFSKSDLKSIEKKGIRVEEIEAQINNFIKGFPYIILEKPAVPGDGILVLGEEEVNTYCRVFEKQSPRYRIIKFVPASGAASRMFKDLFSFLESDNSQADKENLLQDQNPNSVGYCLRNLDKFAFYQDLSKKMEEDGISLNEAIEKREFDTIISYIILPQGLNYGNLPKGLLKFHHYSDGPRTAVEEHLVEAVEYATDAKKMAGLHFTVSPEHMDLFIQLIDEKKSVLSKNFQVNYNITYSVQSPSTDTIAVDNNNEPFRESNGALVFRPGGHGALIENLDQLDKDIVFIKNIDNIVPDRLKAPTYTYKKALGGLLISLKQQIDHYLDQLETNISAEELKEVEQFCRNELMIRLPQDYLHLEVPEKNKVIHQVLNRPLRICGMVKNEGEPGGGPFWVKDTEGNCSLQIVESSQVNLKDAGQKEIFSRSTHFNPVDLVCQVRDHKGKKFPLKEYVDKSTGFISIKSKDGRELKAQELPGLWNGAMAEWISIFVEVPIITFNPVKTINDLLIVEHQ